MLSFRAFYYRQKKVPQTTSRAFDLIFSLSSGREAMKHKESGWDQAGSMPYLWYVILTTAAFSNPRFPVLRSWGILEYGLLLERHFMNLWRGRRWEKYPHDAALKVNLAVLRVTCSQPRSLKLCFTHRVWETGRAGANIPVLHLL